MEGTGYGAIEYLNGDIYKGQVSFNFRHGHGEMTYKDGKTCVGDWLMDKKHGKCKITLTTPIVDHEGDKKPYVYYSGDWV